MSNPFRDPSLWIRTLAFSAAILGISVGLCGLNIGASFLLRPPVGSPAVPKYQIMQNLSSVLTITGICEIGGMMIGAAGIALSFVALLIQIFWRMVTRKE
jgi:hypothetical protein